MIDQPTIDRILDAAQIYDVVSDFVTLRKRGVNYVGLCPFHDDKTPSFYVSPAKGLCKCFACGKGGNAVHFIMEHEQMSYPEALKYLAKKYGIEIKERELSSEEKIAQSERESLFIVNNFARDYFQNILKNHVDGQSIGMAYFRSRGFRDDIIEKFQLGYCTESHDALAQEALKKGYKKDYLVKTGLCYETDDHRLRDRFWGRVIFPVHTLSGKVVAFGGRVLAGATKGVKVKYVNSPESEIYHKSNELYGIYFAKQAIVKQDRCFLVEGYTDVISMHQSGIENVVASSGTALTPGQIRMIHRFTNNMTVLYDGDAAGIKASIRGIDMLLEEGMNVKVCLLPDGDDPDSFARKHNATEFQAFIQENETDFIRFKTNLLLEDAGKDPIKRAELIGNLVQSISIIPEAIVRDVYIKECARTMDIDENVLIAEVARKRAMRSGDSEAAEFVRRQQRLAREEQKALPATEPDLTKGGSAGSSEEALERELVKYLLKSGHKSFEVMEGRNVVQINIAEEILQSLEADSITFSNPVYERILETYREKWRELGTGVEVPAQVFVNHPDPEVCNAAVDILTSDDNYVPSEIWRRKDVHVESESEIMSVGVPKAIMLYRSKVVERMINAVRERLKDENLDDEELSECMKQLSKLNQVKLALSKQSQRLIL